MGSNIQVFKFRAMEVTASFEHFRGAHDFVLLVQLPTWKFPSVRYALIGAIKEISVCFNVVSVKACADGGSNTLFDAMGGDKHR